MVQPSGLAAAAAMTLCLGLADRATAFPNPFAHASKPAASAPGGQPPLPSTSDIATDSTARIGVLQNGLRYAILRSAGEPGRAALRLRFNVGALDEGTGEQGFAQVLSRLPFAHPRPPPQGHAGATTKAKPPAFTADNNADATFDATTFSLDVTTTDDRGIVTGLAMLKAVTGELKVSQADVDRDWGVVLSHERASNDVAYRLFKARLAFLLDGQRPAQGYGAGAVSLPAKVKRGDRKSVV